jgi:hypothetical protein
MVTSVANCLLLAPFLDGVRGRGLMMTELDKAASATDLQKLPNRKKKIRR